MALNATLNESVTPNALTVVSDRRKITITAAGDTMVVAHPIKITDTAGAVWTVKTDDGATAVFTSP